MTVIKLNNPSVIGNEASKQQPNADTLTLLMEEIKTIRRALGATLGGTGAGMLVGTVTADVASIAAGAEGTQAITVTGAAVGDFCLGVVADAAPSSGSLADCFVNARVSATNTVTFAITNTHAATALDLSAAATFKVLVIPVAVVANGGLPAMTLTQAPGAAS